MKNHVLLSILMLLAICLTAQSDEQNGAILINGRIGLTQALPDNPELDARGANGRALGIELIWQKPIGSRFRFGFGLGIDHIRLRTEADDVLPPRFGTPEPAEGFPVTVEATANLFYLTVPVQLEIYPLNSQPSLFLSLRGEALIALNGNSERLSYIRGNPPFGPATPATTAISYQDIIPTVRFGIGYSHGAVKGQESWRILPYIRLGAGDLLEDPASPESGGPDYLRETSFWELGVSLGYKF